VFVFTDADAKDSYRFNELIRAVKAKDIRLELFISNEWRDDEEMQLKIKEVRQCRLYILLLIYVIYVKT
jgi:hypothetical protein